MNKSAKVGREGARGQLWLHLPGMVREALHDTVIGAGLACVDEALEMKRVALCGERYEHSSGVACETRGELAGAGRQADRRESAAGPQY